MFLDIVLITIVVISVITCYRRGIVQSVFNVSSSILTVVVLVCFYKPVSSIFKASEYGIKMYDSIRKYISDLFSQSANNTISASELPEFLKQLLYDGTENLTDLVLPLTDKIMNLIIGIVSFIILFIIIKIVFKFIPSILNSITKLPVIKQANHLFGGILGLVFGLIWCTVLIYAVGLLSLNQSLYFLNDQIMTSKVMEYIHSSNLFKIMF